MKCSKWNLEFTQAICKCKPFTLKISLRLKIASYQSDFVGSFNGYIFGHLLHVTVWENQTKQNLTQKSLKLQL
jgi:hypothetical protein